MTPRPTVMIDGTEYRLARSGGYFEARAGEGEWAPSGDTATKVWTLAPLLGFVRPEDLAASAPVPTAQPEDPSPSEPGPPLVAQLEFLEHDIGRLIEDSPTQGSSLLVRPHVLTRLQVAVRDAIGEAIAETMRQARGDD